MVHAIGDRAQDVVLDGFEKHWGFADDYKKEDANWRLRLVGVERDRSDIIAENLRIAMPDFFPDNPQEHVTVSREDEYPRMKKLGVYPSFMSSFYYWLGTFCYNEVFGPTLKEKMVTFRTAQEHDLIWNCHSDTPG